MEIAVIKLYMRKKVKLLQGTNPTFTLEIYIFNILVLSSIIGCEAKI